MGERPFLHLAGKCAGIMASSHVACKGNLVGQVHAEERRYEGRVAHTWDQCGVELCFRQDSPHRGSECAENFILYYTSRVI